MTCCGCLRHESDCVCPPVSEQPELHICDQRCPWPCPLIPDDANLRNTGPEKNGGGK